MATDDGGNPISVNIEVDLPFGPLEHFYAYYQVDDLRLFGVAWATVLRCYLGLNEVGYDCLNAGILNDWQIKIENDSTAHDLFRALHSSQLHSEHDSELTMPPHESTLIIANLSDHDEQPFEHHGFSRSLLIAFIDCSGSKPYITLRSWDPTLCSRQVKFLADACAQTIQEILRNPGSIISDLEICGKASMQQIWEWNRQSSLQPFTACAHEIIRERILAQPDCIAIDAWDGTFTYAELDNASAQLAQKLIKVGVGPEVVVPLCFEKSIWMIVSILGVLKAGGAFVALDPAYSTEELEYILEQTRSPLALSSDRHYPWLCSFVPVLVVGPETIDETRNVVLPSVTVSPFNLAYLTFTMRDSTEWKGCMIEHEAFCTGAMRQGLETGMNSKTRIFQYASYTSDLRIMASITALIFGATICIPSEQLRMEKLAGSINGFRANWTSMPPSVLRLLKPDQVPTLKTVVLRGEPISRSDVETWAERIHLLSFYGPSECCLAATANTRLTKEYLPSNIGKAIGGVCWITEESNHNRLAPVGAIGELLVQGPTLARGYLNDPLGTAAAFVSDPQWLPQTDFPEWRRLYKTGYLARYNEDGTIQVIGLKGNMVEVNGRRFPVTPIENSLKSHDAIEHTVVLLPKSGPLQNRLICVQSLLDRAPTGTSRNHTGLRLSTSGQGQDVPALMVSLQDSISHAFPAHMVPSTWITVDAIPLLPSGRVNKQKVLQWAETLGQDAFSKLEEQFDDYSPRTVPQVSKHIHQGLTLESTTHTHADIDALGIINPPVTAIKASLDYPSSEADQSETSSLYSSQSEISVDYPGEIHMSAHQLGNFHFVLQADESFSDDGLTPETAFIRVVPSDSPYVDSSSITPPNTATLSHFSSAGWEILSKSNNASDRMYHLIPEFELIKPQNCGKANSVCATTIRIMAPAPVQEISELEGGTARWSGGHYRTRSMSLS
ncbi:hypothetical protein MMC25_007375 [Agyrium rufum]|nr:hypothetical protein [Agyrium rufum]